MARKHRELSENVTAELTQRLLNGAEAFLFAGILCSNEFDALPLANSHYSHVPFAAHDLLSSKKRDHQLSAPPIVNLALSVELYLKLIIQLTGVTYPPEHKHTLLFDALHRAKPDIASKIVEAHRYSRGDRSEFDQHLSEISNAFTQWRYAHEYELLIASSDNILAMALALRAVARELGPRLDWIFMRRTSAEQ